MHDEHPDRIQLIYAFEHKIIPWLKNERSMCVLFADPPIHTPPGVKIIANLPPLPPKKHLERSDLLYNVWREEDMMARRVILLGCMLEGEADITFGSSVVPSAPKEDIRQPCRQVLTLPERAIFIVPPGVSRSMGIRCHHWMRPGAEPVDNRILWLLIAPGAFLSHLCTTRGGQHKAQNPVIVREPDLHLLAQVLMDELRMKPKYFESVAQGLLLSLMLRVQRGLISGPFLPVFPGWHTMLAKYYDTSHRHYTFAYAPSTLMQQLPAASPFVQRVCAYIHGHLHEPLSLSSIAAYACVSAPHLSRLFRSQLGTSVMEYVTRCRMELAKYLLSHNESSALTIRDVSYLVGYTDASYFSRIFKARFKTSPEDFRMQKLPRRSKRKIGGDAISEVT